MLPPGDVLLVGAAAASVQFAANRALRFCVIRIDPAVADDGWIWLEGSVLDPAGRAMERRRIFVQVAGLRLLAPA
ncbi:hypothetical protein AB0F81_26500 [Actinoplanes sp. NPDC024001]|uniref:hypothetical protein n=1 Tax=Actinoplanes sp. NPDC024001 TaxID=3154598 RepID=UPI0033EF9E4E